MERGNRFSEQLKKEPFRDYNEYMDYIFACVNINLAEYINGLKSKYATGQGGYKNVMYPDIEIAYDLCETRIRQFMEDDEILKAQHEQEEEQLKEQVAELDDELASLLQEFAMGFDGSKTETDDTTRMNAHEMLSFIDEKMAITDTQAQSFPFYELCHKLSFEHFTIFSFASAILASTQTSYSSVFQIVNENGSLTTPTIESAARLYFGKEYSITSAYGNMSVCLEQLLPVMDLRVNSQMPFSTLIAPDKRLIDYLFGKNPFRIDENYSRFIKKLTDDSELDPIMANAQILEAMEISYQQGVRIFSYYGDEGSGRKFFVRQFCKKQGIQAIMINCKKLFVYDVGFVERALWAVNRECILLNACCCLNELTYREEEKEKFLGHLDLALSKLMEFNTTVFAVSREKLPLKDVTLQDFTEFELPTPSNQEREDCWKYFSQAYGLDKDVDLLELATKFLFTPGKIKSALYQARSFATMNKEILVSRARLFQGCNNQMSSELTQKATKVKANFGFEDIVMNESQRETLEHAIDQMNFRKQVYDNWHYTKKYPYGRGLSILLFGAPGTGKSMCAQVIAHELNLELYRVDLSKVIDKYVGETEKSISMIFREAKKCNVVLFFDECDTLFAKRSDDGGSNQASNNNKTALLLQEVEAYDGVSVLATNYKHNIDPAFFRRMKYIVEFQFPDPDTREMLWRTTIPKDTPLGDDVDIRFLAERFEFVGGNIKNCILNAAFLAAADGDGKEVCMRHYLNAIKYEFVKTGKVFTKADFEPYAYMVGLGEEPEYDYD
ncbi:MAG: ATP-binding protein [Lachnospiraceae bacterium]|nr:ATP-binding protein [Lachnospiraceae bacterium]